MPAVRESLPVAPRSASLPSKPVQPSFDIIDIRGDHGEIDLKQDVVSMINPANGGPRMLPTMLLYDKKGLQLFEDITYLDEYYVTNYEIDLLKRMAGDLVSKIPENSMIVELGSGNLRKVSILLQAFEDAKHPIDYYALDLSRDELERTLAQVPTWKYVTCHGLWGTYDDGQDWLQLPSFKVRSKCVVQLGPSIGNFARHEAPEFLKGFAEILQPTDSLLISIDACVDPGKVYRAYNDDIGLTHRFVLNGLNHANDIFGEEIFHLPDWRVIGEYVYDEDGGRHQAFVSPNRDIQVLGSVIKENERIKIEESLKYSSQGTAKLWKAAGVNEVNRWTRGSEYSLHLLRKAEFPFSTNPSLYAATSLPSFSDWQGIWKVWDNVTRGMLPDEELNAKPIKLRNACIFYLGHIPTFLDIQLTKTTGLKLTEPGYYSSIFERGIDPDVDNPEKCHDHSDIPDEWPPLEEMLAYQDRVRSRVKSFYEGGDQASIPRDAGRALWLGFEHELMHLETLLYMMLQSDKTLPPPSVTRPDFAKLAAAAVSARVPNEWFEVPEQTITLGMDDLESGTDPTQHYGWDNEKPAREVKVHSFLAKGRPITNEDYARYMHSKNITSLPASWVGTDAETMSTRNGIVNSTSNGVRNGNTSDLPEGFLAGKSVRTVFGPVSLRYALDWPVFASYDELAGCASWLGGRIPTQEEARSIYSYVDLQEKASAKSKLTNRVPAVNAHLVNNGVEETPPSEAGAPAVGRGSSSPELFIDLAGANVGFRNWHPVPVTHAGNRLAGQGGMGGVWEWTSSPLRRHEGFEPMALYPEYTADFFDDKHNVVLGGSWATHPRIAGRKSFVNWYQRNYPYVWAGARLVKDI